MQLDTLLIYHGILEGVYVCWYSLCQTVQQLVWNVDAREFLLNMLKNDFFDCLALSIDMCKTFLLSAGAAKLEEQELLMEKTCKSVEKSGINGNQTTFLNFIWQDCLMNIEVFRTVSK